MNKVDHVVVQFFMEEVDFHDGDTDDLALEIFLEVLNHQVGFIFNDCEVIHFINLWAYVEFEDDASGTRDEFNLLAHAIDLNFLIC